MKPSEQAIQTAINTLKSAGYGITPPQDLGVWKDAPEWAEYKATDADGSIAFYHKEPETNQDEQCWDLKEKDHLWEHDRTQTIYTECENWKDSLIKRPR